MNILVLNCGSSSLKYQLFRMPEEQVLIRGGIEKIGSEDALHTYKTDGQDGQDQTTSQILDHREALQQVIEVVTHRSGVLQSVEEIAAVGHRVVHGGEQFALSSLLTDEVKRAIQDNVELAPLHNPANLQGIEAMEAVLPGVPQAAVFDTAFHQSMPPEHYLYPIPYVLYKRHKVRRYGFHGTSHRYVSSRVPYLVHRDLMNLKVISCHIGNGASVAAIQNGRSTDTSMGMTPLEGVMMGTRSGDIDPSLQEYISRKEGLAAAEFSSMLNKHSGLYGISGLSGDMRKITEARAKGSARSALAFDMYEYRIRKYIGAYVAAMNGVDVLLFTAGVGENSPLLRRKICDNLTYLGLELDPQANDQGKGERIISLPTSRVTVCVIPTNEELMIARDTQVLVSGLESWEK
ncbi:acetate/propionate family kinase [Tumebacillus permanentifrigoris]|uniref:Acetate kinase n=1 Tax=Tumebacillus permanentifrigoris TaxID=378543 RepID=A0A316DG95_9BACL|nr:acetate kinase [Tumebacillus permanentifrigoris]PWK15593.1 acetate kinase [Tumebacillus permanentifrigoris]